MARKIEIFENTLLKLLVRKGYEADRQNIVLSEGELGYSVDAKRLFVGDGQTAGGIPVEGNKAYISYGVTTTVGAVSGDSVYDTSNNKLYLFKGGDPSVLANWQEVGGYYSAGNSTININAANQITVGTIPGSNLDSNIAGGSLEFASNKISLSSTIAVDSIRTRSTEYLTLPSKITINGINYNWPQGIGTNLFLGVDVDGRLAWLPSVQPTTIITVASAGQVPVGTIMAVASSKSLPFGWLECNGQAVAGSTYPDLSAVIGTAYGTGGAGQFKVPDLNNKVLYGSTTPHTSTLTRVASGTGLTVLSATGTFYAIKAIKDIVTSGKITYKSPLSATLGGVDITNTQVSVLTGDIEVTLPTKFAASEIITGPFVVNEQGIVQEEADNPAGQLGYFGPGTQKIMNFVSPIAYFNTKPTIYSHPGDSTTRGSVFVISAYPFLTNSTYQKILCGSENFSVAPYARNLILETTIYNRAFKTTTDRLVTTYPISAVMPAANNYNIDSRELILGMLPSGAHDGAMTSTVFAPLTSINNTLQLAIRVTNSNNDTLVIRAVGYTL